MEKPIILNMNKVSSFKYKPTGAIFSVIQNSNHTVDGTMFVVARRKKDRPDFVRVPIKDLEEI